MATYTIQFLRTVVINRGDRLSKRRGVIVLPDAHVIGLQEIADRAALELSFPPTERHLVINDDSTDAQELAVVVRNPRRAVGLPPNRHAHEATGTDLRLVHREL